MEIKEFFRNLEKDIKSAKTNKTLKILNKRAKKFVAEIKESPIASSNIKRESLSKYRRSLKSMKKREKEVS